MTMVTVTKMMIVEGQLHLFLFLVSGSSQFEDLIDSDDGGREPDEWERSKSEKGEKGRYCLPHRNLSSFPTHFW